MRLNTESSWGGDAQDTEGQLQTATRFWKFGVGIPYIEVKMKINK